jgi:hypothetical protein
MQIRALTVAQIPLFSPGQIDRLSNNQLEAMSTQQILAFSVAQVKMLSGSDFSALTTAQVAGMSATQIKALTTDQISAMSDDRISVLTASQIASLATNQVAAMGGNQVSALTTLQIKTLSAAQVKGMTASQISSIEVSDIGIMSAAQISAMSTEQIAAITGDQMNSLTTTQIKGWTAAQKLAYTSPLVLDLDGNGINTVSAQSGVSFDVNNDGVKERTGWIGRNDGLLVRDLNGDGKINNGGELFGEGTLLGKGRHASDGYEALAVMDMNFDGVINKFDQGFDALKIWQDTNSNGISDKGELKSLANAGIAELSLAAKASTKMDNGNLIGLMGSYTAADGSVHTMGDVWFSTDQSGNHTFDLDGLVEKVTKASTESIQLSTNGGKAKHLDLRLADIFSSGNDELAGLAANHLVNIDGHTGDSVTLVGGGWSYQGDTTVSADTYMVYVNNHTQVMINDKVNVQWGSWL